MLHVIKAKKPNQMVIELTETRIPFMDAKQLKRKRSSNFKNAGHQAALSYQTYFATWEVGYRLRTYHAEAMEWIEKNGGFTAEPLFIPRRFDKNGLREPEDGKAVITLKTKGLVSYFATKYKNMPVDDNGD